MIHSSFLKIKPRYQCVYMASRKMVLMNIFAGQNRDADAENGLGDAVAEGKGGMN